MYLAIAMLAAMAPFILWMIMEHLRENEGKGELNVGEQPKGVEGAPGDEGSTN